MALKYHTRFGQYISASRHRQTLWDFVDLNCNISWEIPTHDESYLSRIFCSYVLMKTVLL